MLVECRGMVSTECWTEGGGVRAAPASRLSPELDRALATGVDLLYLDTAPHSDSAALKVARAADLLFQARGLATREEP